MDKQRSSKLGKSEEATYNFVLKGAKIDTSQPTKEDLIEYELFKSKHS
jgi:hypothetical protein